MVSSQLISPYSEHRDIERRCTDSFPCFWIAFSYASWFKLFICFNEFTLNLTETLFKIPWSLSSAYILMQWKWSPFYLSQADFCIIYQKLAKTLNFSKKQGLKNFQKSSENIQKYLHIGTHEMVWAWIRIRKEHTFFYRWNWLHPSHPPMPANTIIRFVSISAEFGIGTWDICWDTLCVYYIFNKCPIWTQGVETNYSKYVLYMQQILKKD